MNRPAAWAAITLLCTGCAPATATPPRVEVAGVELRGIGLLDQTLGVTLCVTNPNTSELALRRVQVAVDTAGSPLAEGVSDVPVRLPPQSSVLVPFTVVSTIRNLGPQLLGILRAGAVDYRLHGSITLDTLGITLPFSRSGQFGLLAAGQGLLADAVAPTTLRCAARRPFDACAPDLQGGATACRQLFVRRSRMPRPFDTGLSEDACGTRELWHLVPCGDDKAAVQARNT